MKVYLVGGAVRDRLLGLPIKERDYVVVGATPERMQAQGFKPVGRDFPVFLHPKTHEEYALARTERKTAKGHQGFQFYTDPSVTLEEDLLRRDLTINAIAEDEAKHLIDPFSGQKDLKHRVLRHVSAAFVEDPLRVLRVARFRAYLGAFNFKIAQETLDLMRQMVKDGLLQELSHERVWQETVRALETDHPMLFFDTLKEVGALPLFFPALTQKGIEALQRATAGRVEIRFAALSYESPALLQMPKAFEDLARLVHTHHTTGLQFMRLSPPEKLSLLHQLDYLRREPRLHTWLSTCLAIHPNFPASAFVKAINQLKTVPRQTIAASCSNPSEIPQKIHEAELQKLTV